MPEELRFDLHSLAPAVRDALLQLITALVDTPRPAVVSAVPAIIASAEAIVDAAQHPDPARFPRSAPELAVLAALETLSPLPATAIQIAAMVHLPHLEARIILQALAMLGTIDHPRNGYYSHRPRATGGEHGDASRPHHPHGTGAAYA
jgi:hypothetical protein